MLFPFLPDIKFAENKRFLYNRILKKTYINRPEERVRLGVLEQLLAVANWSSQRVGFEIKTQHETSQLLRTDLIAYNKQFKPEILIECKAPEIKIDDVVIKQAFRYNQTVGAKWVICTNGADYKAFRQEDSGLSFSHQHEHPLAFEKESINTKPLPTAFWQQKGFVGKVPIHPLAVRFLQLQLEAPKRLYWLNLPPIHSRDSFSHYYTNLPDTPKHWFSIVALPDESTWLVLVDAEIKPASIVALCVSESQSDKERKFTVLRYTDSKWSSSFLERQEFERFSSLEALKDFLL